MDLSTRNNRLLITALMAVALLHTTPGFAGECGKKPQKEPGLMAADALAARPVGAVATLTGLAVFIVSSPFSALGGNTKEAWESLVVSPASYTFQRPLGEFDCNRRPTTPDK